MKWLESIIDWLSEDRSKHAPRGDLRIKQYAENEFHFQQIQDTGYHHTTFEWVTQSKYKTFEEAKDALNAVLKEREELRQMVADSNQRELERQQKYDYVFYPTDYVKEKL